MSVDVVVPTVGESITEGVLVEWFHEDGAVVEIDEPLFELETDKVTMKVPAPASGRLSITVAADSEVEIGQKVGSIDEAAAGTAPGAAKRATEEVPVTASPAAATAQAPQSAPAGASQGQNLSPSVRRLVAEHQLDASAIDGSGRHGRITKGDVVKHLSSAAGEPAQPAPRAKATPATRPAPSQNGRQTRQRMSSLRRRLAERLVAVQQEAAILTTFNEADMSGVLGLRSELGEVFAKRHGVRLGFMSFFVKAVVDALQAVPALNASIDGDDLVQNHFYDIGVAVGTDRGLVVPVVRDADQLSFAEIERTISDLATRAQAKELTLAELSGACFTVSNGGIYGSLLSTPILNPPQSGILGMHAIKKRPIAIGDEVVVRPMMYLAMSYDHRLVDGKEAVTFLKRVVECIESPSRMMLEV